MRSPPKTVRFWEYVNGGMVRLKLKPDHQYIWGRAEKADEGYWYENHTWEWISDNQSVIRHSVSGGRDCDGPLEQGGKGWVPLEGLSDGNENYDGDTFNGNVIRFPSWESGSSWRKDPVAEAAGY